MEEDSTKKPRNTWTQRESSIETVNARYHPNHNTVDWFSESDTIACDEKAQCFIDQFGKFNLSGSDGEQFPLNGTAGENIAESGGLSITFNAYQSLIHEQGPEQLLPDLQHLTPEQLLFASHGVFTCEVTPKIIA